MRTHLPSKYDDDDDDTAAYQCFGVLLTLLDTERHYHDTGHKQTVALWVHGNCCFGGQARRTNYKFKTKLNLIKTLIERSSITAIVVRAMWVRQSWCVDLQLCLALE